MGCATILKLGSTHITSTTAFANIFLSNTAIRGNTMFSFNFPVTDIWKVSKLILMVRGESKAV